MTEFFFGSAPSVETGELPTMSPEQIAAIERFTAALESRAGLEGFGGGDAFSQAIANLGGVLELDPNTQRSLEGLFSNFTGRSEQDINQQVQQQVIDPTLQQLHRQVIPQLGRASTESGGSFYGSGRLNQEGRAFENALTTITGQGQQIRSGAFESSQNRQLQALLGAGGIANQGQGIAIQQQSALGNLGLGAGQLTVQQQQVLAQLLGTQTQSPYAVVDPGSAGLLPSIIGAGGNVAGGAAASGAFL